MMKNINFISALIILIFSSCTKQEMNFEDSSELVGGMTECLSNVENEYPVEFSEINHCNSDLCETYLPIWKSLLQKSNAISDQYFEDHINVRRTNINEWVQGTSFSVCYTFEIDWAVSYQCDQFIINIDIDNVYYPDLALPRDTFLSEDQIESVVNTQSFSSRIKKINPVSNLTIPSFETAMLELIQHSNVNTLCFLRIALDRYTGNLVLYAAAKYKEEENACIHAAFDLIEVIKTASDQPCYI